MWAPFNSRLVSFDYRTRRVALSRSPLFISVNNFFLWWQTFYAILWTIRLTLKYNKTRRWFAITSEKSMLFFFSDLKFLVIAQQNQFIRKYNWQQVSQLRGARGKTTIALIYSKSVSSQVYLRGARRISHKKLIYWKTLRPLRLRWKVSSNHNFRSDIKYRNLIDTFQQFSEATYLKSRSNWTVQTTLTWTVNGPQYTPNLHIRITLSTKFRLENLYWRNTALHEQPRFRTKNTG